MAEQMQTSRILLFVVAATCGIVVAAHADPAVEAPPRTEVSGPLWTWGGNIFSELGHNRGKLWPLYGGRYKPVAISHVGTATDIAAGNFHSMALDANGSVWTWGQNDDGQLGIGSKSSSGRPTRVSNLDGVRAIAAGQFFSFAVMKDGTVRAWGANHAGQLGDGTTTEQTRPVIVPGIDNVKSVAAGRNFAVALQHDGTVWAWGNNADGQLGDGTNEKRFVPTKISALDEVQAIDCGEAMAIALRQDGAVWSWGYNRYGNLGDGTTTHRNTPVEVKSLAGVSAIACGGNHVLALRNDASVWAWGYELKGELGMGIDVSSARSSGPKRSTPAQIPTLQNIRAVAAGGDYSLAVDQDGNLWAWGRNWNGQFGVADPSDSKTPMQISNVSDVVQLDCGLHHTIAVIAPRFE